jgi:ribosomal protein S15P/S13E
MSEDEDSMCLRNVYIRLQTHTVLQPNDQHRRNLLYLQPRLKSICSFPKDNSSLLQLF